MAVNLIVTEQKFYNQFNNGVDFSLNTSDFTNNLTGSVIEKVKVVQTMEISWGIIYADEEFEWTITATGTTVVITSNNGVDFNNEGFSAGDIVDIGINIGGLPAIVIDNTITIVNGTTMVLQTIIPYVVPSGVTGILIQAKSPLTSLQYRFGLIQNSENFNIISKVSNNDQGYYTDNLGIDTGGGVRDTNFVTLQRLGLYPDWKTGSARARYVSNPSQYVQRYEIEHEFVIVPYYLDGQLTNLQNNIIPTLLNGVNSLKYVFEPGFRTALSNPNTEKTDKFDISYGSIGWFNQRFNGFNNDYKILSINYEESLSGNNADGILITGVTKTTIIVEKLIGSFNTLNRFGVYMSYLPDQLEYQNTLTDQTSNFIYDNVHNNATSPTISGQDFIKSCTATIVSGELVIVIESEYSTAQQLFLATKNSNDPVKYVIGVQIGDETLPSSSSDRVIMIGDVNFYDISPDIPGLVVDPELNFFPYPKVVGVDTGFTSLIQWDEDGFTLTGSFGLNLNQQAFINNIEMDLLAENSVTNQFFSLDSFVFNTGNSIVVGGVQQLSLVDTRSYNLENNSQFNDVSLSLGSLTAGIQIYNFRFSQKISWQDWIANTSTDTAFYDATKPNNNLNLKSSNYSDINNYQIKIGAKINVSGVSDMGVSGITDYVLMSGAIKVYNYDEDGNNTPIWSATIETFNAATNANLNGGLMVGSDTLFRTTYVNSSSPVVSLTNFSAIHRIEETDQNGYDIDELGTLYSFPQNNRVIPKTGLTNLEITIVSGNIVTECLVDGNQLISGIGYNLSSKLELSSEVLFDSKLEEDGSVKLEEDGSIKIEE